VALPAAALSTVALSAEARLALALWASLVSRLL
jgi:hypothetical protein